VEFKVLDLLEENRSTGMRLSGRSEKRKQILIIGSYFHFRGVLEKWKSGSSRMMNSGSQRIKKLSLKSNQILPSIPPFHYSNTPFLSPDSLLLNS
jgi:hypothetical protein